MLTVDNLTAMLTPDQQIGRYRISSAIGVGGMGEVYLAQDIELERSVALKILPSAISNEAERVQRFIQEAKVVSALNHPNILTIHEIGVENGIRFIASEYVGGRTLRDIMEGNDLDLKETLKIANQIASALETAHLNNIVHRDIKPENIMVRDDGLVKVLDFGIAKLLNEDSEAISVDGEAPTKALVKTQFGMVLGTVSYMSPEQTRGVKSIDGRTDIWSLGVVMYEMLTGRMPFRGESVNDVIASILKTEHPRLSEFFANCPPELERIIHKALEKNRDERYQVVRDMALDLKSLMKELDYSGGFFNRTDSSMVLGTDKHETKFLNTEGQAGKTDAGTRSWFRKFYVAIAALIIGLITVFGVWYFAPFGTQSADVSPESSLRSTEIVSWTSSPGEMYSVGTFSPDGKMIAFTSTKAGTKNIWIKQTTSGEAIQITKDEFRNEQPIWSPNGEELAFFSSRGNQGGFWRMPILGGSPKLISAVDDGSSRLRFWSKDNQIYFESKNDIFAIDALSGQTRPITDFASKGIKGVSLSLAPNEKNVAYATVEGETRSLWATDTTGETPKQLFKGSTEIKNISWHPDNKRIFYSSMTDGTFQIFVTDINGTSPRQISFSEQDSLVLNVTSDGTKILYGSAKEESDIWGVNLKDEKEFIVASDMNSELWADVSPDGKTLAYQSIRNLSQGNKLLSGNILTKALGTSEQPVELVKNGGLPKWSPDGKTVAFVRIAGQERQIETIKTLGGEQKQLTTDGVSSLSYSILPYNRLQTSDFSWSPDGGKIVYTANRNGLRNIWLVGADGSNDVQLTNNTDSNLDLYCPLWSSDGKRIVFTSKASKLTLDRKPICGVWVIDAETKNSKQIVQENMYLRLIGWAPSGDELILATVASSETIDLQPEVSLLKVGIESGKMRQINVLKDTYLYNIHLSPDKKTIAYASHREERDNVWVMSASGGGAKKITNNNDSRLYFSSLAWSPDSSSIFFGKQLRYSMLSMLTNFK